MATYSNISIYVPDPDQLAKIERAAKRLGVRRSTFIFNAALAAAEDDEPRGGKKNRKRAA
jgi:uncharacterized protein (DUF1778 family)